MYINLSKKEYKMLKELRKKNKSRSRLCRKSGSYSRLTHLIESGLVISDFYGDTDREASFMLTDAGRAYLRDRKDEYLDDQVHEFIFSILLPIVLTAITYIITDAIAKSL